MTTCTIRIDGKNVSSAIDPVLVNLDVTIKAGGGSDTLGIELDDRGGRLAFPRDGVSVDVLLDDALVFRGTVDEPRSAGARSGGRRLMITAKGMDSKGKAKHQQERHWDNSTVASVLTDAASGAGITDVVVDPALGAMAVDYAAMQSESFIHFGQRLADEIGATFKIVGSRAVLAARNGGTSASGLALPSVEATWGQNLISWELAPNAGRNRYHKVRVRYYDPASATWKYEEQEVGDPDGQVSATSTTRHVARDKKHAKIHVAGHVKKAKRIRGGGSITIDGSTLPQPEALVVLSGARPGVDGTYRIDAVVHNFSRGSGWTTRLDVKDPQSDTGTDKRVAGTSGGSSPTAGGTQQAGSPAPAPIA